MLDYLNKNGGKIYIPLDLHDQCMLIWDVCRALVKQGVLEVEIMSNGFEFTLPHTNRQPLVENYSA